MRGRDLPPRSVDAKPSPAHCGPHNALPSQNEFVGQAKRSPPNSPIDSKTLTLLARPIPSSRPGSRPSYKSLSPYTDCEEGWEEAGYRPPRQVWQSGFTAKAAIVRSTTHMKL